MGCGPRRCATLYRLKPRALEIKECISSRNKPSVAELNFWPCCSSRRSRLLARLGRIAAPPQHRDQDQQGTRKRDKRPRPKSANRSCWLERATSHPVPCWREPRPPPSSLSGFRVRFSRPETWRTNAGPLESFAIATER